MAGPVLVYVVFLCALGCVASSAILSVAFLLLLGARAIHPIQVVSICVPSALVVLFNHILTMPLSTSPLFRWI